MPQGPGTGGVANPPSVGAIISNLYEIEVQQHMNMAYDNILQLDINRILIMRFSQKLDVFIQKIFFTPRCRMI